MSKHPKISIVTVCYNAEKDIEKTILSVINQTYDNIEYIVIDGGSHDGTLSVINKYASKIDKVISEPDKGIYDAMNKGITLAKGDWINFMNAGDTFASKNVLEKIFKNVSYKENIGVIYGQTYSSNGKYVSEAYLDPFWKTDNYLHSMGFCHQSTFVRGNIAKKHFFNTNYKVAADFDMMYNIYNNGYKFVYVDFIVSIFDASGGFTADNFFKEWKDYSMILKRSRNCKYYYYIYNKYIRHILKRTFKSLLNKFAPSVLNKYREKQGWLKMNTKWW